ncbi:MAG: alpha-mannosidase [Clostridiales bacterium]|nr:alpha-mannosidase [Clostridiales bacterium]
MDSTSRKYERRAEELKSRRYFGHQSIAPFLAAEGENGPDEVYRTCREKIENGTLFGIGNRLEGRNNYLWLEKNVEIPKAPEGCETVLLFNFGKKGGRLQGRFEAMLYVDGKPCQGVDENHMEILLQEYEGKTIRLTFLVWTGMEGDGEDDFILCLQQADLAFLERNTDALYWYMKAASQASDLLAPTDSNKQILISLTEKILGIIDWDEDALYESTALAADVMEKGLEKIEKEQAVTVHAVGHTHIDVAWLWRLKNTREKAQRSFSTVFRLMERYPEYIFLQSQPQLYQYVKEDCPELYEKIKEKAAEGKWEPDGGMWVEADCNLPSGESLVRQFLHGTEFFKKEFGKTCEYLWLPDVFGYSWALPQIMKLCGIKTFMTTKISWNESNQIPEDLFIWRGIDGSEIVTYFIETPEEQRPPEDWFSTYNGLLTPKTVLGSWNKFKNKDLSKDILISFGYGDGGGGVNREMLELRNVINRMPGLPKVQTDTAGNFFRKIHENVEEAEQKIPVWDGELYLEFHRGTYTTQGYNKKMNRRMELLLPQTEWLSEWNRAAGGNGSEADLRKCWEQVLLYQFHDIIPGSSNREVYEDSYTMYTELEKEVLLLQDQAAAGLTKPEENSYVLTAFDGFSRNDCVWIEQEKAGSFYDGGWKLDAQRTDGGYLVQTELEPLSMKQVVFVPGEEEENRKEDAFQAALESRTVETPYYKICWNEKGQLSMIYDKKQNREVLKEGCFGNVLELYEDKPLNDDAWNIDYFYTEKMKELSMDGEAKITELGELRMKLEFAYHFHRSSIRQEMVLYRDSARIDFRTWVDWREEHKLLKTAFYTDVRAVKASYDIQFGYVERPTHKNTSWDRAKFEVCGHKWADLSESDYGVSLLNDCKYGYNIEGSAIKLSLLRSPKAPDPQADMGEHTFTYSLYPHAGNIAACDTVAEAEKLNLPVTVFAGVKPAVEGNLLRLTGKSVKIDAVKKAETDDTIIVRLHEYRGARASVKLSSDYPIAHGEVVNLLEETMEPCAFAVENGQEIALSFRPFEIKTVKLHLEV